MAFFEDSEKERGIRENDARAYIKHDLFGAHRN
jgi:hypothetical protein